MKTCKLCGTKIKRSSTHCRPCANRLNGPKKIREWHHKNVETIFIDGQPVKTINLSSNKHPGYVAIIDIEDYELTSTHKWHPKIDANGVYAGTIITEGNRKQTLRMHRLIMNAKPREEVDHRDGNGLNNRRANLRIATHTENQHNRSAIGGISSFKGVSWHNQRNMYMARICSNKKQRTLGLFDNEVDAALSYDRAARKFHGEFASLNFPEITDYSHLDQLRAKQFSHQSSIYIGVCKRGNRWVARITVDRKRIYLGRFKSEIEATLAYNAAAIKYFGDFSKQNVIFT